MISMNRFLMFFPLTAILKSTLIHSLPQGLFDPENSPLISSNPGRAPAPVVNTDTFDINDDNHSDYTVITSDIFSIAEKPENTKKTCLNKSDLEDDELVCPMNISPQGVDQSSPGTTAKPERENDRVPGEPKTPAPKDQKCKLDPWKLHLCGWGPESDAGRNNIPGYFHRRLVGNLFPAAEVNCNYFLFEVCCAAFASRLDGRLGGLGSNCLVLRGVTVDAPVVVNN